MNEAIEGGSGYATGAYWRKRQDMVYYRALDGIVRSVGQNANSLIDVGTGNCPYLDWWDWIPARLSVDIRVPYRSNGVKGIQGDIHDLAFERRVELAPVFRYWSMSPMPGDLRGVCSNSAKP